MRKILHILSLGLVATLLVGCGTNKNKGSSSNSDSGSSSQPAGPEWPTALQTLMEKWCGEVLPYVELKSGYKYEELEDAYTGEPYFGIWDLASKFVLADYGDELEANDWEVEVNDTDPSDVLYTATKDDGAGTFYFVQYYFDSEYGNCIDCWYSLLSTELTPNTAWTTSESEDMVYTLTQELPFMKFGKGYTVQAQGDDFILMDNYYEDLSSSYVSVLTNNGYTLGGTTEGVSYYVKTLADQSTITVYPYYTVGTGNYVYAMYTPHTTTVNAWPAELFTSIETATGYIIPSYSATSYEYYVKNEVIYVSSAVSSSLKEAYETAGETNGFIKAQDGVLVTWEETVAIYYGDVKNSAGTAVQGFSIAVGATTPSSTLTNSWPSTEISTYMSTKSITVSPIACDDVHTKGFKYFEWDLDTAYAYLYEQYYESYYDYYYSFIEAGLISEEEIAEWAAEDAEEQAPYYVGFYIHIYSEDGDVFNAYKAALESAPWYVEAPKEGGKYWYGEDGTGDCAVYFIDCGYYLEIQILKGKGEAHAPSLTLNKTTAYVKPGGSLQLTATKQMIVEPVSFSSSDESIAIVDASSGLVEVKPGAAEDSTVTITASAGTYEATCVITVKNGYSKVMSTSDLVTGQYLIVCETKSVAFKGSVAADASGNKVAATASEGMIPASSALEAEAVTITKTANGYTIQDATGKYIGNDNDSNKLTIGTSAIYSEITITDGNADIVGAGGAHLRYNSSDSRFRYYKSTSYTNQTAIQLYYVG